MKTSQQILYENALQINQMTGLVRQWIEMGKWNKILGRSLTKTIKIYTFSLKISRFCSLLQEQQFLG